VGHAREEYTGVAEKERGHVREAQRELEGSSSLRCTQEKNSRRVQIPRERRQTRQSF
jgi:hypothetical protein